ncbi:MAG: peptidoglycan editing factor PgeF [Legionellaceae bacterium]|nr:peptidoglycan editing factor PgeF [Legionellaceae bacterium]
MQNIIANWNAPKNIKALTTTRISGASIDEFASNNFGIHVDDNPIHVAANRQALKDNLKLPGEPIWLNQTHTNLCVRVNTESVNRNADATISQDHRFPLVVMTADCVPIVLCNSSGLEIAAIHAGWRGLANGIIENTLNMAKESPENYMAWIGPAICVNCYATGDEVLQQFSDKYTFAEQAFTRKNSKLHANLPKMAELVLNQIGVKNVFQSNACTFEENNKFYSYRRSSKTGRIATLIWFEDKE